MSDPTDGDDAAHPAARPAAQPATGDPAVGRFRSGSSFVVAAGVFVAVFLVILLVVTPRLQDNLGLNSSGQSFEVPDEPVEAALTLDDVEVGRAIWDGEGVCAEVTDRTGTTYRTCAVPDPLRPFWAIDAPDDADPAYVIVATPPEVVDVRGRTTDGEALTALAQARELPSGWALIPLPPGATVDQLVAFDGNSSDLGDVVCGGEDAPTGGPDRLAGGCVVPQQD